MNSITICSDCGAAYQVSGTFQHICEDKREAAAKGWEGDDEALIIRLKPNVELLTRVRGSIGGSLDWDWHISISIDGLLRTVTVKDPSLPPPHDVQVRKLANHENWEEAFKALGLLP